MLPEKIIYIGILTNVVLASWYIKEIIWGNNRPNLVSWFLWTLAPLVGFFLQVKAGAGLSASSAFVAGFFPLLTIIVCLWKKNNLWKINLFDIACGALSIFALILYILTKNLAISIIFAILSDGLAYGPTLVKSWKFPETESSSTYIGGIVHNITALLIITQWDFAIYAFPLYLLLANGVEVCFIYRKKISRLAISA